MLSFGQSFRENGVSKNSFLGQEHAVPFNVVPLPEPEGTGYVLIARILDIQIPGSTNCSTDFVEIRDGPHWSSPLLAR